MKYKMDSDHFLLKIKEGKIDQLSLEELEIFQKILPKANEIQKLKENAIAQGFNNVEEAKNKQKLGRVEEFIYQIMLVDQIEKKVDILTKIMIY